MELINRAPKVEVKISGNKGTVKRSGSVADSNIRPLEKTEGQNPSHSHANLPPSTVRKVNGEG